MLTKSMHSGNLYIVGDFNLHVNKSTDKVATRFVQIMDSMDLIQRVKKPTHIKGNTLDLMFHRTNDNLVTDVNIECNHTMSDHYSVIFSLNLDKPKRERKIIEYRNTKNINIELFVMDLEKWDLTQNITNAVTVEYKMKIFNDTLLTTLNAHAPIKTKLVTIRPNTEWYTTEISDLKRKRRKAEITWRKSKSEIDKQRYNSAKHETNKDIIHAKKAYIKDNLTRHKNNPKQLYKIMNSLLKHESTSPILPDHQDYSELVECFNTYFNDKIRSIRTGLDKQNTTCNASPPTVHQH